MGTTIICPHCNETVSEGNFCEQCGCKMKPVCDCWILKQPYTCDYKSCPIGKEKALFMIEMVENGVLPTAEISKDFFQKERKCTKNLWKFESNFKSDTNKPKQWLSKETLISCMIATMYFLIFVFILELLLK